MDWKAYQNEFIADGNLREIIINNVTQQNWQKILNFLVKTEVTLHFFIDSERSVLPSQVEDMFQEDKHQYKLSLLFDDVTLNADLARRGDMVFSFDPGQITNEAKAKLLFRVMSTFGRRLNKLVLLTEENNEEQPVFQYEPAQGLTYIKLNKKFAPYE